MRLLPVVSGILAALTLFTPINSYLRTEPAETKADSDVQCEKVNAAIDEYLPGIVCWGDSLTAGVGGNGVTYPDVLSNLIKTNITGQYCGGKLRDVEVINYGVGGESSVTIAGRSGTQPIRVEKFTIPADSSPVRIRFMPERGLPIIPMFYHDGGMNPVTIAGVEGTISSNDDDYIERREFYFTRSESGDEAEVEAETAVIPYAADKYLDYLNVVFIGTNGGFQTVRNLVAQQRAILSRNTKNPDRFIIVGIYRLSRQTEDKSYYDKLDAALEKEYGDRFINLREYLMNEGLSDTGITPTDDDLEDIEAGRAPSSLLDPDKLHLNPTGYELLGKLIYDRMESLGYFDEVKTATGMK